MDVAELHVREYSKKLPFLVLTGIRGLQHYNPARVMLKFGRTQITPIKGDTISFFVDHNGCIKIPLAMIIVLEWTGRVNMKCDMTKNRYEVGYVYEYQMCLQKDLYGVVNPTPRVG